MEKAELGLIIKPNNTDWVVQAINLQTKKMYETFWTQDEPASVYGTRILEAIAGAITGDVNCTNIEEVD